MSVNVNNQLREATKVGVWEKALQSILTYVTFANQRPAGENASVDVRRRIVNLAAKNGWNFRVATEEYLASLAERTNFEEASKESCFAKVKEFFTGMLNKAGIKLSRGLSDNELRYFLWKSYRNLEGPGNGVFDMVEDAVKQYEWEMGNYHGSPTLFQGELFREESRKHRNVHLIASATRHD